MISIVENDVPDLDWNKRLLKSGLGTIYQAKERADFLAAHGQLGKFLKFIDENNEIVGQLLIRIDPRFNNFNIRNRVLNQLPFIKQKKCSWLYGPIIFDSRRNSDIFSILKKFIDSKNYAVDGWTHPFCNYNLENFSHSFNLIEWGTYTINLSKEKSEIYHNIAKHSGRKNIERSIKKGVSIEEITEDSLYEYYKLKTLTRETSGQKTTDFELMLKRWKQFKPLGFSGFIAKYEKIPIGGLLFTYYNDYIIEIGVARSVKDRIENLYSQDLIKWKIIEWGIENKMKYYDLAGFNPNPISKKEEGIIQFKKKWGGQIHQYYRILDQPSNYTKIIRKIN